MTALDDETLTHIWRVVGGPTAPDPDAETLAHIRRTVAEAPPFSLEQIATLRRILGPGSEPCPDRETMPHRSHDAYQEAA